MPHANLVTRVIPEQAYQDFLHAVTHAINASNEAKKLKDKNADKASIVKELITSITHITKNFKIYAARLANDKLFFPQLEEFIFSFISKKLYELKVVVGNNYSELLGTGSIKAEIIKIEIYLHEQLMQLQDYQRSLKLSDKTRILMAEWQKDPLKKIDWQGLQQYKKELTTIQERFKTYKTHLNPDKWLKPLSEFSEKLELITPGTPLVISPQPGHPTMTNNNLELRKDLYALERILNYFDLAISVDLDKEPLGPTIIERALQVAGEYFKSSAESPHLSPAMEQKLQNLNVPIERIAALRNSLSHSGSFIFSVREKIKKEANKLDFFRSIQRDLIKIKLIVEKIIYRINLKETKSQITAISNANFTAEIQQLLAEISVSEDLNEIGPKLNTILEKIETLKVGDAKKHAIKLQIEGICINLNLKKIGKYIRQLNALNLDQPNLEDTLVNLDKQFESEHYAELNLFKKNRVTPSKSTITAISETKGLNTLPVNKQSINFSLSNAELFNLLVKTCFKQYSDLYSTLTLSSFGLGKHQLLDEGLLAIEIDSFIRTNQLPLLTIDEQQELIGKFKLFNQLELIKTVFLESLEEIKFAPIEPSVLQKLSVRAKLDKTQKTLLKLTLFELHQDLFFNQFFESYFDTLLTEIKGNITATEFNELKNKIDVQKNSHSTLQKLLAFSNGLLTIPQEKFENLVNAIPLLTASRKTKLLENYSNKSEVKKILEEATSRGANPYENLLNGIKNQELISELKKKFANFSKTLALDPALKDKLDVLFEKMEIKRFEKLFLDKLEELNQLLDLKKTSGNTQEIKASYEMLLSDLTNTWGNLLKVADPLLRNRLALEPLLLTSTFGGKNFSLRNYLAHGDPLFDTMNPNFIDQILKNIPTLVKDGKALLALKKLMDDNDMRDYLLNDIIKQGHIDQLSAESLPSPLQSYSDLIREYKQSPSWKAYLETINPNASLSVVSSSDQSKALVKELFEKELREAASKNDLPKLNYCSQQGISSEASDEKKWSAIYYAIDEESYEAFNLLLDKKVKLDRLDTAGFSPIHYTVIKQDARLTTALFTKKKLRDSSKKGQWHLLHLAAVRNNRIIVNTLLQNKINKIEESTHDGFTALLAAVYFEHTELAEHLITTYTANVHAVTTKKFSVAHLATINKNLELLKKIKQLDNTLALDRLNKAGWSAIHIAALKNLPDFLQYFIENKVDPNLKGKDGITALHVAAQEGWLESIDYLMRLPNINSHAVDQYGRSVLLTAVANEQLDAVEKILHYQPDLIHLADAQGWSPLHAATRMNNLKISQFLLKKGAQIDREKWDGATAAHIAAENGYLEILEWLKVRNANFDKKTNHGWTLLHLASFHNNPQVVDYLLNLAKPLEVNDLTPDGFTALHLAAVMGHTGCIEKLVKTQNIQIDKKTLAPIPHQTIRIEDATASHLAAKNGHLAILQILEENGADLRLTGNGEWTHLHLAADSGHQDIVHYLLEKNPQVISIDAKTEEGATALHRAAYQGHIDIVNDLLLHQANVHAETKLQATPLHLAALNGKLAVVDILLQNHAQLDAKTSAELTPLALAAQSGHLNVVEKLLSLNADALAKNNHDTVLHRAAMTANPEIIKRVIEKIKTQHANTPEIIQAALNASDKEGDSPLMWAVQGQNANVLEVLLQAGADFQTANPAGYTAFDMAVRTTYPPVDRSDKNAIKIWKVRIEHQQKIIDLLYLKTHSLSNNRAMKDRFAILINEEFRAHISRLAFETLKTLHNKLDQTGNIAFWSSIAGKVRKRIKEEYPDITLNPTTQSETPALRDLMRTFAWVSLDDLSLNELNSHKSILAYKKLQKKTIAPAVRSSGCKPGTSQKRKRSAALACLDNEEIEKFDPLIEFDEKEKEASTLLMASAQTAEQRTKLSENIIHIQQIKAEGSLNQSQMELRKLDVFHENLEKTIERKEQYLKKTDDIDQAKVIRVSDHNGKSVYLSLHSESLAGKQQLSIYCPQINGYGPLQLNPDLPISEALELYATLLFPDQATQSLSYEYYTIPPSQLSTLYDPLDSLTASDFRSDKSILESNNNLIEGLKTTEFRELFLINGEMPEIEQLHTGIFNDPDAIITFRSDKIVNKLWQMTPEQQTTLATVLNKYSILEASPSVTEDTLAVEVCLQKFNRGFIEQLKKVTPETPITHAELTERSKQYLREELLTEGFEPHEIDKVINNVVDLHGDLHQGLSRAVGMTRQGIFLAPAIIQAMNGDTRGLTNLLMMMGGDMAIDHVYQALLSNAQFIERFPKTSGLLSKSARYLASPIGKILLLDSFIELGKQMQESEPGSPEYQLAESLLADNSLFFATMVAEVIGLELGPAGILLDIGITIHQLLTTAKYYRDTLPFKISFWESIEVSLGFKKTWLEEKFAEHYIRDVQLRQMNDLSRILNKVFYAAFIRDPLLEIAMRQEVTLDKLPSEMQTAISNHPRDPQSSFEWSYKPPEIIYRKYIKVDSLPVYRRIFYRIKTVSNATTLLEPVKAKQENSIFLRTHQVCHTRSTGFKRETNTREAMDAVANVKVRKKRMLMMEKSADMRCLTHPLYSQGYWRVAGSTLREDGEEFTSPIKITGGLAGLMLNNRHPDLSEQNLLINFNSCFGDTSIIGGSFLKDKLAYVLISNLMMENLIDPLEHIPVTKFSFRNTKNFTANITYIVSQNYHPSEITDDAQAIHIVLLPINFKPELSGLRSLLDKATFSTDQAGKLYLGEVGPQFIGLDAKKRVIINFHKDYSVSGEVAIKTKTLQLEQVRGNITNPANFLLTKEQNFAISLLAGKTIYQLDASKVLEVTFNDTLATQGPRITKSTKETIFKLFIREPLCDLAITKAASTTSLSLADILTVQTFNSNATLSIHGNYFFKDNQTCQAELKIMQGIPNLTLIDILDHKQLLRDPSFFNAIRQQNLKRVNFYHSATRSNTDVTLYRDGQQITYQAITYRLDSEHGLVAIQGRTNPNATSEDFSDMLTPLIDLQSNTTLPLRLNSTTIEFAERQFLNLKPNSYVLTAKGKVPIGLLPLQLPTPQQGDSIRLDEVSDLLHPSVEIDRVSLKPGVLGSSDSLMVHYRPKLRLKRTISASIAEEDAIEICFKKSDDRIPKTVVIDGKSFPIDFSELPLLNPQEPIVISHNQFEQLSHCAALQTEEVNGEILAEMRLEKNKTNQVVYRVPLNMQSIQTTFRFIDTETKQEKQLSIKLPVHSKYTWQYASAGIGVAIFGAATSIAYYFKPQNNNPLPMAAAALPLLPHATAKVIKTMTETTSTMVGTFWETATRLREKIQGKQSNEPRIEPFTNTNKQSFFGSTSFFSSNPSSTLSDLGEQFYNKADKSGLLQLMHFYALSRTNSKQAKTNTLQTFRKAKDREQAVIIANKIVSLIKAEIKQQAKQLGISYWDLAVKIDLTKLQKNLIAAIEVGNMEAVSSVLHDSIKGIKKLTLITSRDWKALETYIDYLVDQLFFQTSTFTSVKQCKV